jgi:osmoprotectant transport system permease protein
MRDALIALVTLVVAWLWPSVCRADDVVIVGSKAFTESRVLGEIVAQTIERSTGLVVKRREGLGGTEIVFRALESGEIDIYPEYTGTAWSVLLHRTEPIGSSLRAYVEVKRALEQRGLLWLAPLGFDNSYALAVSGDAARRMKLARISDLVPHARTLRAGLSHEFLDRADGYPGLAKAYGLDLGGVKGMEHGLAYEAIRSGAVDVIDTYSTDGKLPDYDLVVLDDDRRFFPPYDAALLARADLAKRHPRVVAALEELSFRIDAKKMRELNHRAEQRGGRFAEVASEFLAGDLATKASGATGDRRRPGLLATLWQHRSRILARTGEHLALTAIATLLAILVAVPLGIWLTRRPRIAPGALALAGAIQTIPSLALLALLIPLPGMGLGGRSAVAALFLYALLPLAMSSYAGIRSVDPELVDAARAIGLSPMQVLRYVELPLAMRTIFSGMRTAAVIGLGVATLAAFIGAGGLGDPIITGLQLDDLGLVLSGAIPAALLAIATDFGLGRLERALVSNDPR